jgi:hypothetical protein
MENVYSISLATTLQYSTQRGRRSGKLKKNSSAENLNKKSSIWKFVLQESPQIHKLKLA